MLNKKEGDKNLQIFTPIYELWLSYLIPFISNHINSVEGNFCKLVILINQPIIPLG